MTLDEIVVGLHPTTTASFPELVIRQPSRADFRAIQTGLVHYSPVSVLTKLDVEKELPDDYYRVRDMAQKKRDEIILQLTEGESPDERFLKTPEEIRKMQEKEQADYLDYHMQQYGKLNSRLELEPVIRQFSQYEEIRLRLMDQTKEHEMDNIRMEKLFSQCAEHQDRSPYFNNIEEGVKILEAIPIPEYSTLMREFSQYVEGVDPSFF